MAEPVVSLVLETITKLLIEEKKFLSGVSDEAEKLRLELQMMQAFLRDADKKQNDEQRVKVCVSLCRDLAYEAENVLEDYAFKLSSRRKEIGISSVVKRFARILNECIIRHNVGVEIQSLNTRISTLTQRFQDYGVIKALTKGEGSASDARQQQSRMTYSFVANDEDIVGIEGDVQNLVEVLVENGTEVVSITGMGGSGKTTLARKVYNHSEVKSHFHSFAWVCVSQQWQTRKLLQEILASFNLPDLQRIEIPHLTENEMVEKLVRFQENKKCLVVLDDVWEDDVWKCIQPAFSHNCKILVTTRNQRVAKQIGPSGYHHQPKFLDDVESLDLLLKKAFGHTPDPGLEDIEGLKRLGMEMVKNCGGLPLAIIVLGGILASKKNFFEWEAVSKDVRLQKSVETTQGILDLSYNDLPYYLKPCFLYMSVMAEDERMDGDRLFNLWISEGMVLAENRRMSNESIKDVARRYLGELVQRCIVMVHERSNQIHERFAPSCYLHDLMRDMCKIKAREENFIKVLDYASNDVGLKNSISNIPRVMINSLSPEKVLELNDICRSLRALGFRTKYPADLMVQMKGLGISKFMMLRSLVIEGVKDSVVKDFKARNQMADGAFELPVGKLIHLRQLSLRECELAMSPLSISNLEHLEILDLVGSIIMWTKKQEIRTRRLSHLILPRDVEIGRVPAQIICVPNDLEVIYGQIPNRRLQIKNLSQLTNVRELGGAGFEKYHAIEVAEDLCKCILNSQHLKEVVFQDRSEKLFRQENGSVLVRNLLCSKVETICFEGSFCTLPDYDSNFARNLTKVYLISTRIEEDPMKLLEAFPHLQELYLYFQVFTGKEMVCHSKGFPRLRFLMLTGLRSLEMWTVEKGAMPNLYHLEIYSCSRLKLIPEEVGSIPTLKQLVIKDMGSKFVEENVVKFSHVDITIANLFVNL